MQTLSLCLAGAIAVAGLCWLAGDVSAETIALEMKKVDLSVTPTPGDSPLIAAGRLTRAQSFSIQMGSPETRVVQPRTKGNKAFSAAVTQEPEYKSDTPFKGVALLGSEKYAFAFDSSGKDVETSQSVMLSDMALAFDRLYFDLNCNGDLTDDGVIEAETARATSPLYVICTFPATEMKVECDGDMIDYAFTMSVYTNVDSRTEGRTEVQYAYAKASLSAAVYRQGEITLDGEKQPIVLVDRNSNGRFDDYASVHISHTIHMGSTPFRQRGDMLFVNPQADASKAPLHLMNLMNIENVYYDVEVTPSGDQLTIDSSDLAIGYIASDTPDYRADIYGDLGFLTIQADETGKAAIPEGEWRFMSYSVQAEEASDDESVKPRVWRISIRGPSDGNTTTIVGGETKDLSFGAPFKPVVTASPSVDGMTVSLGLSVVGVGGGERALGFP